MKIKSIVALFLSVFLLPSCIKNELPYKEADIEFFNLNNDIFLDCIVRETENVATVFVKDTANLNNIEFRPTIRISAGATISPSSETPVFFHNYEAEYIITSEDKNLTRKFIVKLEKQLPVKTDFSEWETGLKYPVLTDKLWDTANSGIALATVGNISVYPTGYTSDPNDILTGTKSAKLQTIKGGKYWGKLIPIFSGSLFRGKFQLNPGDFLKSTLFGQIYLPETGNPEIFSGDYKYTPGEIFTDENGNIVPNAVDECSIYAILYKVEKGDTGTKSYLTGLNILTSDRIVAKAILEDRSAKEGFTRFSIPFVYSEKPDYNKYDYRLSVVFASSKDGDSYRGAIGSTLIIDNVSVSAKF